MYLYLWLHELYLLFLFPFAYSQPKQDQLKEIAVVFYAAGIPFSSVKHPELAAGFPDNNINILYHRFDMRFV